jgi:hypothetical protein
MNEQIKKLAKEAGCDYLYDYSVDDHAIVCNLSDIEKLAELIIAECLKKVEEEYKPVLEDKEMMKDTHWDGYVQCGVDSYVAIREHFFGVQE